MLWEEVQACGQFRIKELGGSTGEPAAPRALPRAGRSPLWLWALPSAGVAARRTREIARLRPRSWCESSGCGIRKSAARPSSRASNPYPYMSHVALPVRALCVLRELCVLESYGETSACVCAEIAA